MTEAKRIDGNLFSGKLRETLALHVQDLRDLHHVTPGLAVVLVGNDPASQVYVRTKHKRLFYISGSRRAVVGSFPKITIAEKEMTPFKSM